MRDIKLLVEFDGTNFVGWQMQATGRTVQEEITKVLDQILQEPVNLIGSGRTDAGVHARGMVASFRTNSHLSVGSIQSGLNGILPEDVYVHAVEEVLEVIGGEAEIWIGEEKSIVRPNQSVLVPAGFRHGFRNVLTTTLHVRATLAASIFEASYDNRNEVSRRWLPG